MIDIGPQKVVMNIGKSGILWKLDRINGKFLAAMETLFRNVFDHIDPKTGEVACRADLLERKTNEWIAACPGAEGGHNWQATSNYEPTGDLIIPLSQSCTEMNGRDVEKKDGSGGTSAPRRFHEMPGTDGNVGKLVSIDVKTMEENRSIEQRALPDGRTDDGGRLWLRRRPESQVPRLRCEDRRHALAGAARNVRAGLSCDIQH